MAQYKVPQDVEADDKLLGPFSFRQFVYLMIAAGLIAVSVFLFQLFPLLAAIPLPFVFLLGALALPLKKDQPMETYLAAIVTYYLKPHKRIWMPGQRESTIQITAPKIVEENRTRNISSEEATHRLSFLADIVDTEGYAIKGASTSPVKEDLVAEANSINDMFESNLFDSLNSIIKKEETTKHNEVVKELQNVITTQKEEELMKQDGVVERMRQFVAPKQDVVSVKKDEVMERIRQDTIAKQKAEEAKHNEVVEEMRNAIDKAEKMSIDAVVLPGVRTFVEKPVEKEPVIQPARSISDTVKANMENTENVGNAMNVGNAENVDNIQKNDASAVKQSQSAPKPSIIELAHNPDYSIQTIAKEANRLKRKDEGEVFISLH